MILTKFIERVIIPQPPFLCHLLATALSVEIVLVVADIAIEVEAQLPPFHTQLSLRGISRQFLILRVVQLTMLPVEIVRLRSNAWPCTKHLLVLLQDHVLGQGLCVHRLIVHQFGHVLVLVLPGEYALDYGGTTASAYFRRASYGAGGRDL